MGDSWSPGCAYTGSPNLDLGANDPRSPVSVDPWYCSAFEQVVLPGIRRLINASIIIIIIRRPSAMFMITSGEMVTKVFWHVAV